MKSLRLAVAGLIVCSCACAILQPKPTVQVYYRADLETKGDKLIIMPLLSFDGKKAEGVKNVELALLEQWNGIYGKANIIPAGPALAQLPDSTLAELVKSLDTASAVEQIASDGKLKDAVRMITGKIGGYNMGVAMIDANDKDFISGKPVHLNIGIFDTRNMTWKWIAKGVTEKGRLGRWEMASAMLVRENFKAVKTYETAK